MAVITISRELGALGEEVAGELSSMTGYRILDRDLIEKRLVEHGMKSEKQMKYDEMRPGFWSSLSEAWPDYIQYLKLALYEEAAGGDCIVMGRGGTVVFRHVPNHLAIRITAPLDQRIARIMRQHLCDERQARHMAGECDHNRLGFSKIYFDIDWADPREYDLTINTARLDAAQAARIVMSRMALTIDAAAEQAGKRALADRVLGQKVQATVACSKKAHLINLTVTADSGVVTLDGLSNSKATIDAVIDVARSVPGVSEINNAIHLVQEYTVVP